MDTTERNPAAKTAAAGDPNGKYAHKRVLLKLSGESLAGEEGFGINAKKLLYLAGQIGLCWGTGIETSVVVGGGNFWRGERYEQQGMDRSTADYAGMLGTIINAVALQDALENENIPTRVLSAMPVPPLGEPYIRRRAIRHMEKGRVAVFAGGTGNPYMSTDTAAALRALEIGADALLMAKNGVDGVYDSDPKQNPNAKMYSRLTHHEALSMRLGALDSTALSLCMDNRMPIIVFNIFQTDNLADILSGNEVGTVIAGDSN